MPIPDNVERLFRALHEEAVKEYDDTLHQVKAQNARIEKVSKVQEKRRQDLLRSIGANVDQLEKDQRNDVEALKTYLDEVRPSLISRPSIRAQETKEHALRAATLGEAGHAILRPYAASVMAPEASMIADIEGERGNPWVFPTNPGQINIQRTRGAAERAVGRQPAAPQSTTSTSTSVLSKPRDTRLQRSLRFTDFIFCDQTTEFSRARWPR